MNFQKFLGISILLSALTGSAFAAIVDVDLYQTEFEVARSARSFTIQNAKRKSVLSQYIETPNPAYDSDNDELPYITTPLKTAEVIELRITYEHQDAGEREAVEFTANLPLNLFRAEDLETLSSRNGGKRVEVVKNYVQLEERTVSELQYELVCDDLTFDSYTYGIENCPRLRTKTSNGPKPILAISRK